MKKDLFGVNRLKINLHTHTTRSDGAKTPEEVAEIYKKAGYDVIAITDHWNHLDSGRIAGLRSTISAAETDAAMFSIFWASAARANRL